MRRAVCLGLFGCLAAATATPALAQDVAVDLDALAVVYGDNTEFRNPFREGETLVGSFGHLFVEAHLNDRVSIRAGAFGAQRFGSANAFDVARPVLAIVVRGPRSQVVFGTLDTTRRLDGSGPDRLGPHGLLPPLQRETLLFDRAWESGFQWTFASTRLDHESWVHWQRLGTPEQREIFDVGSANRIRLRDELALRADGHVVHQGGQISNNGPVADSWAMTLGVEAGAPVGALDRLSLEGDVVASRYTPDRAQPERSRTGGAAFVRVALEESGWRVHGILWRADDFIKVEGDLNYQALQRDGGQFRAFRDYAEAGLTRTFTLAPGSFIETSVRLYRTENHVEYSFRILAVARVRQRIR